MALTRRAFLAAAAGTLAGLSAARMTTLQQTTWTVQHTHHTVRLAGLKAPVRVALATDLHVGPLLPNEPLQAWMDAITAIQPDLVLLGGDLIDRHADREDLKRLTTALKTLHPPLGTVGVWGNHDYASALPLHEMDAALNASGVRMLKNERAAPRHDLHIIGLDDLLYGRRDLTRALQRHSPHAANVLISHNPDVIPSLDARAQLTLAGHTHGGQIVLPGGIAPFSSSRYGRRFLAGWVTQNAYVSRGLGVAYVPARVGAPAELAVFDLTPT